MVNVLMHLGRSTPALGQVEPIVGWEFGSQDPLIRRVTLLGIRAAITYGREDTVMLKLLAAAGVLATAMFASASTLSESSYAMTKTSAPSIRSSAQAIAASESSCAAGGGACERCSITCKPGKAAVCTEGQQSCSGAQQSSCLCLRQPTCRCK